MPIERQPLTTTEVAAHFKRRVSTIRSWVRNGWLRPMPNTGGRGEYLFPQDEIARRERAIRPNIY